MRREDQAGNDWEPGVFLTRGAPGVCQKGGEAVLNHVALQGRLTRDPELRSTGSGIPVTSFSLAVNGKKDDTAFIDCVAWRGTAEAICQYLGKGRMMVVEGSLQSREWNDKDGNRRKSIEVNVSQFHFCDKKEESPTYRAEEPKQDTMSVEPSGFAEIDDQDGDLPF